MPVFHLGTFLWSNILFLTFQIKTNSISVRKYGNTKGKNKE